MSSAIRLRNLPTVYGNVYGNCRFYTEKFPKLKSRKVTFETAEDQDPYLHS